MAQALSAEQSGPVLRKVPGQQLHELLDEPLPESGCSFEEILTTCRERILPYCRRNGHPRFFGYVCTSADPLAVLADAMTSAMNQLVTAWRSAPSASSVERLVVRWLDELVRFGGTGSGLLVGGGSSANFHALACAVTAATSRESGVEISRDRLTIYISTEGHVSLRKAARLLGVPSGNIRNISVDSQRRMRTDTLHTTIAEDIDAGFIPAAVCASAGTANAGTIDPLDEVARIAHAEGTWFHIDGSYGAPAVMTDEYRWIETAFARADSLSLDPHKWLFSPADVGCVLIRDEGVSRRTFTQFSEYTAVDEADAIESYAFFDHGLEMSRRFRGLKLWTTLKARGTDKIKAVIEHDIALRRHLDEQIAASANLEGLASELSICCFRYLPSSACTQSDIDSINKQILEAVQEQGNCYMSPTSLEGRYALRACIVSFRTTVGDVDTLLDDVLRLGTQFS